MQPAVSAPPVIDEDLISRDKLDEFAAMAGLGRPDFAARILGLWKTHAQAARAAVDEAMAAADREAVGRAAHGLKSMSLNAGAARVAEIARTIETIARTEGATARGGTCHGSRRRGGGDHLRHRWASRRCVGRNRGSSGRGAGRGDISLPTAMPVPAAAGDRFATDLKAAIAAGEIQPFFQPIVSRGDAGWSASKPWRAG